MGGSELIVSEAGSTSLAAGLPIEYHATGADLSSLLPEFGGDRDALASVKPYIHLTLNMISPSPNKGGVTTNEAVTDLSDDIEEGELYEVLQRSIASQGPLPLVSTKDLLSQPFTTGETITVKQGGKTYGTRITVSMGSDSVAMEQYDDFKKELQGMSTEIGDRASDD